MIKRLKKKFIVMTMTALVLLLAFIVAGMNIINYQNTVRTADETLATISSTEIMAPGTEDSTGNDADESSFGGGTPPGFVAGEGIGDKERMEKRERFFEQRGDSSFFTVLVDSSGNTEEIETASISYIDDDDAQEYLGMAEKDGGEKGFAGSFRYSRETVGDSTKYTFLECTETLANLHRFLITSIVMSLVGLLIIFIAVLIVSGMIVRPVAESYEKQKRFITDAGHEIKTPLTIINANVDVMEMEEGENECLTDIRQQVERLTGLTNDLVMLSRMEEGEQTVELTEIPVSDIVSETVSSFTAVAKESDKNIETDIQPMLSMKGDHKTIEQLTSILMENALKYSPEGETISVKMKRDGRNIDLNVHNKTMSEVNNESLSHVFDRFYRMDESRNSDTGGHGIGLSVAQAIVNTHGGKIRAWTEDGSSFDITATFPALQ